MDKRNKGWVLAGPPGSAPEDEFWLVCDTHTVITAEECPDLVGRLRNACIPVGFPTSFGGKRSRGVFQIVLHMASGPIPTGRNCSLNPNKLARSPEV